MRFIVFSRGMPAALLIAFHIQVRAQETHVEEVVVTSTALHENPLQVAQPTVVLGGDDLRRDVASSIGETLAGQLGISSTYFGPSASQPVIRGLGGYRVQLLQDGSQALDVSSLSQDHAVSIESVVSQQIEVIKGPASLLYGSGAAGGLVNVVTTRIPSKMPSRTLGGALELRGDSAAEERTAALSVDGGGGPVAFHADYFDRETDDVKIPGFVQSAVLRQSIVDAGGQPDEIAGRLPNSASDASGGAAGASYIAANGYAGLALSRYETSYGIPAEETAFIDLLQDRLDARGEWNPESDWLDALHLSGAYSDYTHTEFEAPAEPGTTFDQHAYELRVALDHRWRGNWRGTFGAQYTDVDFVALGKEAFVPPYTSRAASVFAFEERHFGRWTIELGARAEQQQIDPASVSQRAYDETAVNLSTGFVLTLADEHALAINLTRTQRHPQAAELYANGPHLAAQRVEIGDDSLDEETAYTVDASLRHTGDGLRWTLSAFYNDYRNFIFLNPTGAFENSGELTDPLPVFDYRQAGAKLYGYEAELLVPVLRNDAGSLEVRIASDYVRGKLDSRDNLPQIPPLRIGGGLHFESNVLARRNRGVLQRRTGRGHHRRAADRGLHHP